MKTKIVIRLLCVAAILAFASATSAQTPASGPKVQLPSGETVWDLNGDWDVIAENYGPWERFGTYPTVFRITQTGQTFDAIRVMDNPQPFSGRAGSPSLQGELETKGFKHVWFIDGGGIPWLSQGQIRADGKTIMIEGGERFRVTLTRPGEPDKLKAMLLRPAGWKAEWSLPGEYDKAEGEWIFEARGDKVVANILITSRGIPVRCEQNVTITSDVVKFDGCFDPAITLLFDPHDQEYPLKGKSFGGNEYKAKVK